MKILYVKNTSERAKEFQLQTVIYEKNGKKFVKKQAMCKEAIPHLMKMVTSADKLRDSIIDSKIKITEIVEKTDESLIFEYIDGISFEEKYNHAKSLGKTAEIIEEYYSLVKNGFKTTFFDTETMLTDEFKQLLGDFDYTEFQQSLCFKDISNIDLLLSNIIFKDEDIYIIDYEWVYDLNIPIDFAIYRTLHENNTLHDHMEEHFIKKNVVNKFGFLIVQNQYTRERHTSILNHIDAQVQHIKQLDNDILSWQRKTQELTIKGRIKIFLKYIFPLKMLQRIKAFKKTLLS